MKTPKCEICDWTNTGLLKISGKYMCHSCIQREFNRLKIMEQKVIEIVFVATSKPLPPASEVAQEKGN